jgi:hypothetical protein
MLDSVFREYLEELFGMPESHADKPDSSLPRVDAHPSFKYLTSMLEAGNAKLLCTGVAFNLLNHRPDVCALLLINEESWFCDEAVRIPLSSWPSASSDQLSQSLTTALPLASPLWLEVLRPSDVSPPGAASIVLGVRRAFELLKQPPPEWLCQFN